MVDREAGTGEAVSPGLPIETVRAGSCVEKKNGKGPL